MVEIKSSHLTLIIEMVVLIITGVSIVSFQRAEINNLKEEIGQTQDQIKSLDDKFFFIMSGNLGPWPDDFGRPKEDE